MFNDFKRAIKLLDSFKLCWDRHSAERAALEDLRDIFLEAEADDSRLNQMLHVEAGNHNLSLTDEDLVQ